MRRYAAPGSRNILLIETRNGECVLFQRALIETGIEATVSIVSTGAEALPILKGASLDERPQLIVASHQLCTDDESLNVLLQLRREPDCICIPLIMFTGSCDRAMMELARASGVNAIVEKPIDYEAYVEAVRDIADFWLHTNLRIRKA
ncbi:MAG: hypothetical protein ACAH95_08455 [Fimbriimonas sp.]